ncbi:MAG: alpha-mannosidase, partial [Anaerolineae bacterium]|nr:alpha-mannosidase [Anaerolineae bacterium]
MKHGTILLIGNAHIDPVWLWQWPKGMHEVKATFRSALDRMNENPNFKFTASSSQFYAWVEECDPGMFKEIQARVAEGRWELVGGWWVEPDCNIPCGESFVRQGLYGQRYLLEKFGRKATIGYNVDSFGHHAMLPQILSKMGLREYVFMRPSDEEKALPTRAFLWQSADGSQVRAFRIFQAYNSTEDDLRTKVTSHIPLLDDECDVTMCFYGVGDHGGGPTKKSLASIARMQSEPGLPELRMAVVAEYFDRIGGLALPVIRGELQHHSRGCYSAHAAIKKANRKAEVGLLAAEHLGVMARDLVGWRCPDLEKAWKTLLFNQFHDTLAGTAIEAACEDALHALGSCQTVAQEEAHKAIQAIASQIKVDEQECIRPIQVFNPCGWARNEPVELEFIQLPPNSLLLDDQGKPVPIQDVGSATVMDGKGRLCFMADLPAMGYRTYKFLLTEKPVTFDSFSASDTHIENQYLRVDIDPENGSLSIFDK